MRRIPSLLSSALVAATACTQSVELGGPATLVRIDAEAPGANCETGGVAIHTGLDVDDDRYLDDTEVSSTQYACSGVAPVACAGGTVLTGGLTIASADDWMQLQGVHCVDGDLLVAGAAGAFPATLDLERVTGDVVIAGNPDTTSLGAFANLDAVGGVVLVQGNDALADLGGLGQLTRAAALNIVGNRGLVDLAGLDQLVNFPGSMRIANNPNLASLDGLDGLTTCDGTLAIRDNPSLGDVNLDALTRVTLLELSGNDAVQAIALPALAKIESRLLVSGHAALTSVTLPQLSSVGDLVRFESNPVLATIELPQLVAAGSLSATGDPSLRTLTAPRLVFLTANLELRNLTVLDDLDLTSMASTGADATFVGLGALPNFAGLANLGSIGGNATLRDSAGPTSMTGLGELALIAGDLIIDGNNALASLDALATLASIGGDLGITDNVSLGDAAATSFANGVDVGGDTTISGND